MSDESKQKNSISMSVIRRLPRYYRFLTDAKEEGTLRISSQELARRMGLTASQIRQDLNCFGGFGQQGYGYDVTRLLGEIGGLLGVNMAYPAIMIGGGNLGRAVAIYLAEQPRGFDLQAIFEKDKALIGRPVSNINVMDVATLEDYCRHNPTDAAILCIPSAAADKVVASLYDAGIRYFWNFSHYDIMMKYPDAIVENVHLGDSLMTLCYLVARN